MVSGVSYEYVKNNLKSRTTHCVKSFLNNNFNIKSRFIKFNSLKNLKNNCILVLCSLDKNIGEGNEIVFHSVVYDNISKRILDPDISDIDIHSLFLFNIVQCLEILND